MVDSVLKTQLNANTAGEATQQSLQMQLSDAKHQISADFGDFLASNPIPESKLSLAVEYALLNGGKRMRPLLVNLVGQMLGVKQTDLNQIALAIECIHAYSLVHDDLPAMDDDDLRRGNPTCHIKFDEATAILAGDALQCMAFEILATAELSAYANEQRAKLIANLSKAAGACGMVGGQSIDLVSTDKEIDLDQLRQLHNLKTGAILTACVTMPCLISEKVNSAHAATLLQYAKHVGLAFQIQDDILDVVSDTSTLGKPQGSDESANKSTFVSLLGLDGAQNALAEHHQLALTALQTLPYNTHNLTKFTDFLVTRTY